MTPSEEADVDLRALQRPRKKRYRTAPDTARATLRARGAQAACAQLTRQMVATALAVPVERIEVTVEATSTCVARSASPSTCQPGSKPPG
jgi:hypothetical protein